jgi:hypothetical protein
LKKGLKAQPIVSVSKNLSVNEELLKGYAHPLKDFSTGWTVYETFRRGHCELLAHREKCVTIAS